ncbi:MAG: response regulator [Nitrospirales bacterium]|nr:response regulator [Nitrospira sp.]MDR4500522.1 response regulator [Nitrospirales bacterium]
MVSQGNLLLADDEEIFLEATGELLENEGFACHKVRNAEEICESLTALEFDLLITDLNMPGNRVLEMVDEVRMQAKTLPVIVLTGYPSVPSAVESVRLHVLEYMIKPVPFPMLLDAVKRGVRQKQVLRTIRAAKQEAERRTKRLAAIENTLSMLGDAVQDVQVEQALVADPHVMELQRQVADLAELIDSSMVSTQPSISDYFRLREGLYETIQVLQRTKGAFKSKELGELRKHLQALLENTSSEIP